MIKNLQCKKIVERKLLGGSQKRSGIKASWKSPACFLLLQTGISTPTLRKTGFFSSFFSSDYCVFDECSSPSLLPPLIYTAPGFTMVSNWFHQLHISRSYLEIVTFFLIVSPQISDGKNCFSFSFGRQNVQYDHSEEMKIRHERSEGWAEVFLSCGRMKPLNSDSSKLKNEMILPKGMVRYRQ